jgi:hypothetical protein
MTGQPAADERLPHGPAATGYARPPGKRKHLFPITRHR